MTRTRSVLAGLRRLLPAVVALLLLATTGTSPQLAEDPDPRFERVAAVALERMKADGIPGVALGISYGASRRVRGFGVTSVENPLPVTADTLFQAGSITKTFTASVVMRLVEEGRLTLDRPVTDYLPDFRVDDPASSRLATLRTLLTHMGGWEGDLFDDPGDGDDALARIVERMARLPQLAPVNTIWSYNNAGFYVAGRIIEVVTGQPYEAVVRARVIEPLGLRHTVMFPEEMMPHRFAAGHAGPPGTPIVVRPWGLPRALHPAGGVVASVSDLVRYGKAHLDWPASGDPALLSPESLRQMHATQLVKQATDEEMALGWQVSRIGGFREIWHDGAAVGQQSLLFVVPSKALVVAVLANSVRGERFNRAVRNAVAREYLGVAITEPAPVPIPPEGLAQYAGRYSRPFMDVVVTVEGDRLMIQRIQKQGFPTAASTIPPAPPPAPYVFYAPDRLMGIGPVAGDRVEFIRRPDGSVGWIRVAGRIAPRCRDRGEAAVPPARGLLSC